MGCAQIAEGLGQISQASQGFMEQQRQMQTRQQTLDLSRKMAEKFGMPGFETYDPSLLNAMISMGSRMDTPEDKALKMAQASYYTNPPVKPTKPTLTKDASGNPLMLDPATGKFQDVTPVTETQTSSGFSLSDLFSKATNYLGDKASSIAGTVVDANQPTTGLKQTIVNGVRTFTR